MSDVRWMTYDELATAMGIAPDSARRLVARKKWARRQGNDGKARIGVPADVIPTSPPVSQPDVTPDKSDTTIAAVEVLSRHIERLEAELASVKAERDVAKEAAMQLSGLKATIEAVSAERDRWHAAATAPRGLARLFRR